MRFYNFGVNQVITSAATQKGQPVVFMAQAVDHPAGLPNKDQLLAHEETIRISFATPDGAFGLIQTILDAVELTAKAAGVNTDDLRLPVVHVDDHNKALERIKELETQLNLAGVI